MSIPIVGRRSPAGNPPAQAIRPITELPIGSIQTAPENELLYRPVVATDPEIVTLAASIRTHGVREPLVISLDNYIVSGHRRHMAARLAKLKTVPCRVEHVRRSDPGFMQLLREYNRQRIKSFVEITREEVISADPAEAHRLLVAHRSKLARFDESDAIEIMGHKHRAKISYAKLQFLETVKQIIESLRDFWPLSVRQIHYRLLNIPPLIHASKSDSRYANTVKSYKAAVDLLARARIAGLIPWQAIDDETRPVDTWKVYPTIAPFVRDELGGFLKGYYRDLLQSQPNQIEIVGEKNGSSD